MRKIPAIILAAGAALAAPAFADTVATTYVWDADAGAYVKRSTVVYDGNPARATYVAPIVTYVEPSPTVTYVDTARATYVEPTTVTYAEPPIVVTSPYLTEDQAITGEVMDRIAGDGSIHGRVGVETYRNTVTLSGRVGSPWQAEKAQRHAQNTPGVREVNNELRSRIGG